MRSVSRTDSSRAQIPAPVGARESYPHSMRHLAAELRRTVRREPGPAFDQRYIEQLCRGASLSKSCPPWARSALSWRPRHPAPFVDLSTRGPQRHRSPEWPLAIVAVSLCQPLILLDFV